MRALAHKSEMFELFLDSMRDADGLVYSDLKADELRPWRNEDFAGYEIWDYFKDDYAGYTVYEDSIMATGRYASVKILKHHALGGDAAAAKDAEDTIRALIALAYEGDKIEPGFLAKPHGGMAKAHNSRNISTDQCEHWLFALWRFHQAFRNSPLVPEIEKRILMMADYYIRNDFTYLGYNALYSSIEPKELDKPMFVSIHMLGLFLPLLQMSYEISNDEKYRELLTNKMFPTLFACAANEKFIANQNMCNLMNIGLYFVWKRGYYKEELSKIMERLWKKDMTMLSADGLGYAHPGISDDHHIEPHYEETDEDEAINLIKYRFMKWRSNRKTAHSVKTAHSGALLQRVHYDEDRAQTIHRILNHFEKPQDFLRYIDYDGRQLPPEYMYMGNTIPLQFIGAWLEAYYLNDVTLGIDGF